MKESLTRKTNCINSPTKRKYLSVSLGYFFAVLFIVSANQISIAQGDPYEYEEGYLSAFEETDLYIDSYNKQRSNNYEDAPYASGGGYLGVGIASGKEPSFANSNEEILGPPSTPTYPDVPVNGCKEFLILAGLCIALFKLSDRTQ